MEEFYDGIFSGTSPKYNNELEKSVKNDFIPVQSLWRDFVAGFNPDTFYPGLSNEQINKLGSFFPEGLKEIFALTNGQKQNLKGVFKAESGHSKNSQPKFLGVEQSHSLWQELKNDKTLDVFSPYFIPFAVDSLKAPDDVFCLDSQSGNILLLWVAAPDYFSPPEWQYAKYEVAESMQEFIIQQATLAGIPVKQSTRPTTVSEVNNDWKSNLALQQVGLSGYSVFLPADYFIKESQGADFSVYYFLPIQNSNDKFNGGIYLGGHPNPFYKGEQYTFTKKVDGRIMNTPVEWAVCKNQEGLFVAENIIQIGQFEFLHFFANAFSQEKLQELIFCFSTLTKKESVDVNKVKPESTYDNAGSIPDNLADWVVLYEFKSDRINVNIGTYFGGNSLVVEGYELGELVKEMWDDSDYEYKMTVREEYMPAVFRIFNVSTNSKNELLQEIRKRFHDSQCFSKLKEFFDSNEIKYDYFSWI